MKDIEITAYGLTVEVDKRIVSKALKRLNKGSISSFFKDATQSDLEQLFDVCNVIEDEEIEVLEIEPYADKEMVK